MNLYVGNLSPETTEEDLRQVFSEFGEVVSSKVLRDPETGMTRGFGFVELADKYTGYDAIDNLDMTFLQGNIITVKEAKPRNDNNGGGGRGGNNRGGGGYRRPFTPREGGDRYNNDRGGDRYNNDRYSDRPDRSNSDRFNSDRSADRPDRSSGDRYNSDRSSDRPDRGDRPERERFRRRF